MADELSRRELLGRATLLAGAGVLAQLTDALRFAGWLDAAHAATPNAVEQTMNGLVAFVVPGRDRYSRAQGTRTRTPGGIEAGAARELVRTLDRFLPSQPPLSAGAATILNATAARVAPGRRGPFASAFANLTVAQKASVFQALEGLTGEGVGAVRFLAGNLPGLAAFLAFSETGSYDRRRRRLLRRPVGWRLTHYAGLADGRKELKGYFQGRRAADPDA